MEIEEDLILVYLVKFLMTIWMPL